MRVFTATDPVFKTEPLFIAGCSHDDLDVYLKRRFHVSAGADTGQCGQMFTFDRVPWRVVWTKTIDLPSALHEVFHLVTRICQDKGVPIRAHDLATGESLDEPAAYLFEFFARAVLKRYRSRV